MTTYQAEAASQALPTNKLGFTHRDYEGRVSTLCAGCGHDSISAALIQRSSARYRTAASQAFGIGCSSRRPIISLAIRRPEQRAWTHAERPHGANLGQQGPHLLGVLATATPLRSGLDNSPIVCAAVNMVYVCENNGVYVHQGQFSGPQTKVPKSKAGVSTRLPNAIGGLALVPAEFVGGVLGTEQLCAHQG